MDSIRDFLPASATMEEGSTDPTVFVHHGAPRRSVVVIDEIDKAPRDFPNDLLDELDHMRFRVPEVREAATPPLEDRNLRPVVLITSNRERQLPDAFLRRCLFFEIPFPGRRSPHAGETDTYTMEDIVARRLAKSGAAFRSSPLVRDAIDFFYDMRALADPLNKRPATAELIDWLDALRHAGADPQRGLSDSVDARRTLSALFKNGDDLTRGRTEFDVWVLKTRPNGSQA